MTLPKQDHYPNIALFILSHIQIDSTEPIKLQGGEQRILEPWNLREGMLSPLAFKYSW
jgi:hypothetical protein